MFELNDNKKQQQNVNIENKCFGIVNPDRLDFKHKDVGGILSIVERILRVRWIRSTRLESN